MRERCCREGQEEDLWSPGWLNLEGNHDRLEQDRDVVVPGPWEPPSHSWGGGWSGRGRRETKKYIRSGVLIPCTISLGPRGNVFGKLRQ
jgi:hypothetical protein